MARFGGLSAMGRGKTPFPTRQMAVLGELPIMMTASKRADNPSSLQDMRTHRFHVNLPIRFPYGPIIWLQRDRSGHVHWHGHISVRIHGVRQWNFLGPIER